MDINHNQEPVYLKFAKFTVRAFQEQREPPERDQRPSAGWHRSRAGCWDWWREPHSSPSRNPLRKRQEQRKRRPTPADAAIDYVAYLLDTEGEAPDDEPEPVPEMRGQQLIDTFINSDKGRFSLSDVPLPADDTPKVAEEPEEEVGEEYFTETLARIYIKQGRYSKALEIIRRLSLQVPKKKCLLCRPNTLFRESDH